MTAPTDFDWTAARVKELTKLWASGLSAAEIGRRMGITKNAVVGKVRRLDLTWRRAPGQRNPIKREHASLADLKNSDCVWPMGEPQDPKFRFCSEPTGNRTDGRSSPYCPKHTAIAWVPPKRKAANA